MTGAPRHPFLPARRYFELLALPPLRPAAFFWAVVPPCLEELELELELDPDFLPPRLEAPGEFAIRAARSFDMPFFFSPSYCFSFFTLADLLGTTGLLSPSGFFPGGVTVSPDRTVGGQGDHAADR